MFGGTGTDAAGANVSASTFSAQKSSDGQTVVLRMVNYGAGPTKFTVTLKGETAGVATGGGAAKVWTLSWPDPDAANPVGAPALIAPETSTLPSFGSGSVITVPGSSYTVVELAIQ